VALPISTICAAVAPVLASVAATAPAADPLAHSPVCRRPAELLTRNDVAIDLPAARKLPEKRSFVSARRGMDQGSTSTSLK
jgi:hypothetical protein